jgi:hypothetical protein
VGKASSAKKVAKVAESARGVKVREPRGKVFPAALATVIILGTLLIAYSRQSSIANASTKPTTADHWHVAYGIYNCDKWLDNIKNTDEEQDAAGLNELFKVTGIHTHGDGVIHIHPYGSAGTGKNAKLGSWLKLAPIKFSDTTMVLPAELGSATIKNGDKCGDKAGTWKVLVWDDAKTAKTTEPKKYLTAFNDIRFTRNGMALAMVFNADDPNFDYKTLEPPSAANLDALGAADSATGAPVTSSIVTVPGETTVAGADSSTSVASSSSSTAG